MSLAEQRKRLAKLESRKRRIDEYEPNEIEIARWMGFCLHCAATGHGTQQRRERGVAGAGAG